MPLVMIVVDMDTTQKIKQSEFAYLQPLKSLNDGYLRFVVGLSCGEKIDFITSGLGFDENIHNNKSCPHFMVKDAEEIRRALKRINQKIKILN